MSKKNRSKNGSVGATEAPSRDNSPHVAQRDKLKDSIEIRNFPWTDKQKLLIDLILDKDNSIIFVSGPAGTAKTLVGVYCGLLLLNQKRVSDILYIRSVIESASKSIGALPGEISDKFCPFLMPMEDKLEELIKKCDADRLIKESRISAMPINFLRGASFNAKFILADEVQNMDYKEITTLVTRMGKFSKLVICGDYRQSDINGKSGFKKMFDLFNDEISKQNGIHCFEFTIEDVMRSGVVKYILEKLEQHQKDNTPLHSSGHNKNESMFPEK